MAALASSSIDRDLVRLREISAAANCGCFVLCCKVGDAAFAAKNVEILLFGNDEKRVKVEGYTDSKPLLESIASTKIVENKFLIAEVNALKKLLEDQIVQCYIWVKTEDQLADVLTKNMVEPTKFRGLFLRNRGDFQKFEGSPRAILKVHEKGTKEESIEIRLENNDKGRF